MLPAAQPYFLHPQLAGDGHEVEVLLGGARAYPEMLAAIALAEREILLETYAWKADESGRRFAAALIERARAGVRVRCVVDGLGSFAFPNELLDELRSAGVEFAVFHPVGLFKRESLSVRDHRKLLVVDGEVGFLGGLNITSEYAPKEWGGGGWHDVHIKIRGHAVNDLTWLFARTWAYVTHEHLPALHRLVLPHEAAQGTAVQILSIDNRRSRRVIRRHYEHAFKKARRQILIMAAYFIPDRGLRRILRKAVARGVEVRVLLPHRSDVPIVQEASRYTYASLLRAGVQIYEWLPAMMHAKTIVVDGAWCAVGSYNIDRRSLLYNWELSMATDDPRACRVLEEDFERLVHMSLKIDRHAWAKRSWLALIVQWFAYLFRNWL